MTDVSELVARLRAVESSTLNLSNSVTTNWHRNPDGPEAADALEAQAREIERLRERLEEATDLLGFAEARLLAFGQHNSTNPDYVLAMDAMKLFLLTADAAMEGGK